MVLFTPHHSLDWMVSASLCMSWLHGIFYYLMLIVQFYNPFLTCDILVSERFGDGDTTQVGLDLEEVILFCLLASIVLEIWLESNLTERYNLVNIIGFFPLIVQLRLIQFVFGLKI